MSLFSQFIQIKMQVNSLKRLIAVILILCLSVLCGCSDSENDGTQSGEASPTAPTVNMWNNEQLREFGLKTLECPSGVVAEKWEYSEDTHSILALLTSVEDYEALAEALFEVAKKSSGGVMTDSQGNAISELSAASVSEGLGMYLFYYKTNGTRFYASTIYYDEGSELLGYPKNSVLLSIKDVAYINY